MGLIKLETIINTDPKKVFDLARNIDLHHISTKHTNEKAIAGRISGLIELNETVTWQAKHFGVTEKLNQGSPIPWGKLYVANHLFKCRLNPLVVWL